LFLGFLPAGEIPRCAMQLVLCSLHVFLAQTERTVCRVKAETRAVEFNSFRTMTGAASTCAVGDQAGSGGDSFQAPR
jgi:hypothetical protein